MSGYDAPVGGTMIVLLFIAAGMVPQSCCKATHKRSRFSEWLRRRVAFRIQAQIALPP